MRIDLRYLDVFGAENATVDDLQNIESSDMEFFLPPAALRKRLVEYIDLHIRHVSQPEKSQYVEEDNKSMPSEEAPKVEPDSISPSSAATTAVEIGETVVARSQTEARVLQVC